VAACLLLGAGVASAADNGEVRALRLAVQSTEALGRDHREVATGSRNGIVRLWRLDLVPIAERLAPRGLTPEVRSSYGIGN
jgi:hypothetical protein